MSHPKVLSRGKTEVFFLSVNQIHATCSIQEEGLRESERRVLSLKHFFGETERTAREAGCQEHCCRCQRVHVNHPQTLDKYLCCRDMLSFLPLLSSTLASTDPSRSCTEWENSSLEGLSILGQEGQALEILKSFDPREFLSLLFRLSSWSLKEELKDSCCLH